MCGMVSKNYKHRECIVMHILRNLLPFLLLLISFQSQSATIRTDITGNTLLGFDDISVGGNLYDVTFIDGTYNGVFGTQPLTFNSLSEANDAADAIDEAIEQYPSWQNHSAGTPVGISSSSIEWGFLIPHDLSPTG